MQQQLCSLGVFIIEDMLSAALRMLAEGNRAGSIREVVGCPNFNGTPKIIAIKAKIRTLYNDHFMFGFSAHLATKASIFYISR